MLNIREMFDNFVSHFMMNSSFTGLGFYIYSRKNDWWSCSLACL